MNVPTDKPDWLNELEIQEILQKDLSDRHNLEKHKVANFFRETHFFRKIFKKSHKDRVSRVLDSCVNKAHFRLVQPGEQVFRHADRADTLYFVITGSAAILIPKKYQQILDEKRNRAASQKQQSLEARRSVSLLRLQPVSTSDTQESSQISALGKFRRSTSKLTKLMMFTPFKKSDSRLSSPSMSPISENVQNNVVTPDKNENSLLQRSNSNLKSPLRRSDSYLSSPLEILSPKRGSTSPDKKELSRMDSMTKRFNYSPRKTQLSQQSPFTLNDIPEDDIEINNIGSSLSKLRQISAINQEDQENGDRRQSTTSLSSSPKSPIRDTKQPSQQASRWMTDDPEFINCFRGLTADDIQNPSQYFEGDVFKYSLGSTLSSLSNTPTTDLIQMQPRATTCVALTLLYLIGIDRLDYSRILKESEEEKLKNKVDSICSSFSKEQVPNLNKIMTDLVPFLKKQTVSIGEYVYNETDKVDGCFIVKKGEIELTKYVDDSDLFPEYELLKFNRTCPLKEINLSIVGEGQFFGEEEILQKRKNRIINAKCKSATTTVYFVLKQHFIRVLYESLPVLQVFQGRAQAKDNWHVTEFRRLSELLQKDPTTKKGKPNFFMTVPSKVRPATKQHNVIEEKYQDTYEKLEESLLFIDGIGQTESPGRTARIAKDNEHEGILRQSPMKDRLNSPSKIVSAFVSAKSKTSQEQGMKVLELDNQTKEVPCLLEPNLIAGAIVPSTKTPLEAKIRSQSCTTSLDFQQKKHELTNKKIIKITLLEDCLKHEVWAQKQMKRDMLRREKLKGIPSRKDATKEEKAAMKLQRSRSVQIVSNANYERIFKQAKQSVKNIQSDKIQSQLLYTPTYDLRSLASTNHSFIPKLRPSTSQQSYRPRPRSSTHDNIASMLDSCLIISQNHEDREIYTSKAQQPIISTDLNESITLTNYPQPIMQREEVRSKSARTSPNHKTQQYKSVNEQTQLYNSVVVSPPIYSSVRGGTKVESCTQTPFTRTMTTMETNSSAPKQDFQPSNTLTTLGFKMYQSPFRKTQQESTSKESSHSNQFPPSQLPRNLISQNQKRPNSVQTRQQVPQPYLDIKNTELSLEYLIKTRCSQNLIMQKKNLALAKQSIFERIPSKDPKKTPQPQETTRILNSSLLDHLKGIPSNKKTSASLLYTNHQGKPIRFRIQ